MRLLVHPSLIDIVMFSQHKALIACVDNDCIIHQIILLQVIEQTLYIIVDPLHTAQVSFQVFLVCQMGVLGIRDIRINIHVHSHIPNDIPVTDR